MNKSNPFFAFSIIFLLVPLTTGCQASPEQTIVGNWQVNAQKVELPSGGAFKNLEERIKRGLSQVSLKMKADKTFEFIQPGPSGKVTGTWELSEKKVTMTPKEGPSFELAFNPEDQTLTYEQDFGVGKVKMPMYKTG
jgi:hypothetical protein